MTMLASIIISTHNRHQALRDLLEDLRAQGASDTTFEVIVVDSSEGLDPTAVIEIEAALGLRVTLILAENVLASKRNAGAAVAKGAVLIFLDDDLRVGRDFVDAHLNAHRVGGRAVSGAIAFPHEWITRSNYYRYKNSRHLNNSTTADAERCIASNHIVAMNLSIDANTYRQLGGFDEDFRSYGGEDQEFGFRVASAGLINVYVASAQAVHWEIEMDVRVFASKVYRATFSGTPIVLSKIPDFINVKTIRLTEGTVRRPIRFYIANRLIRFFNAAHGAYALVWWLDRVDLNRRRYYPIAYHAMTLAVSEMSARDRRRGGVPRGDSFLRT